MSLDTYLKIGLQDWFRKLYVQKPILNCKTRSFRNKQPMLSLKKLPLAALGLFLTRVPFIPAHTNPILYSNINPMLLINSFTSFSILPQNSVLTCCQEVRQRNINDAFVVI